VKDDLHGQVVDDAGVGIVLTGPLESREADAVQAKRESGNPEMTDKEKADAEKSVKDTVAAIREEREKQTGKAECS